jgi:hypothetical protein
MATTKKDPRGRKKLPKADLLHPITIRVKYKHLNIAHIKAMALQAKYR